jgi:hypothetical protein
MYINFKIILGATVRCKYLEVTVACPYFHTSLRAQGILLMYFVMVIYKGKRVVGFIVITLKIVGMMPCEV